MSKQLQISDILLEIKSTEGDSFEWNEEQLFAEMELKSANNSTLAIKVLSIFGGFLATLAFLGFLFISGLYDSKFGLIFFGALFIILSIISSKVYNKLVIDTSAISAYVMGFAMLAFGLTQLEWNETIICFFFIVIAIVALRFIRSYVFSFISFLIMVGSLIVIFIENDLYNGFHFLTASVAIFVFYLFQYESQLLTNYRKLIFLYDPLRIAAICSFIVFLYLVSKINFLHISQELSFISSSVIICLIIYLMYKIRGILLLEKNKELIVASVAILLLLIPTINFPAISGSILIILCCFRNNYKTGFAIGVLALLYFVSQFYYDLTYTLLVKSLLMLVCGIIFFACYFLTNKRFAIHEEN